MSSIAGQLTDGELPWNPLFQLYLAILISKHQFLVHNGMRTLSKQLNQLFIEVKRFGVFCFPVHRSAAVQNYCCYQDHSSSYLIASMHAKLSTPVLAK